MFEQICEYVSMRSAEPLASLTLPGGQVVEVECLARWQAADRTWWYTVRLSLYAVVEEKGRPARVEPSPAVFNVPFPLVQPIEGVEYGALRASPTAKAPEPVFVVEQTRMIKSPTMVIHLERCWVSRPGMKHVTIERAADLVQTGQAAACDMCHPEQAARQK